MLASPLWKGGAIGMGLHGIGASDGAFSSHSKFQLAYGMGGRTFGVGVTWAHLFGGGVGGTDTFDAGAGWRPFNGVAAAFVIEDFGRPRLPMRRRHPKPCHDGGWASWPSVRLAPMCWNWRRRPCTWVGIAGRGWGRGGAWARGWAGPGDCWRSWNGRHAVPGPCRWARIRAWIGAPAPVSPSTSTMARLPWWIAAPSLPMAYPAKIGAAPWCCGPCTSGTAAPPARRAPCGSAWKAWIPIVNF